MAPKVRKLVPLSRFKTRAKTAYGLLTAVRRHILAEPLRINMDAWLTQVESTENAVNPDKPTPACGTIGCIGGWTEILAYGQTQTSKQSKINRDLPWSLQKQVPNAQTILGANANETPDDFYSDDLDNLFFSWDTGSLHEGTYGTKKYARAVECNIATFQKKYAGYLKSVKLADTMKGL